MAAPSSTVQQGRLHPRPITSMALRQWVPFLWVPIHPGLNNCFFCICIVQSKVPASTNPLINVISMYNGTTPHSILPGCFLCHTLPLAIYTPPKGHFSPLTLRNVVVNSRISVCFASPGDGGHGYLKDWLWWAGLLTSK